MAIPKSTNIWIAAGDGDLARVRELVEQHGVSPNAPDHNTYTPMHAAASYAQIEVLEYLIAHGGDVNITDGDGDTPLYTVEDVATARFLVTHGAGVHRTNSEGVSPAEHLTEDFPEVTAYLRSIAPTPSTLPETETTQASAAPALPPSSAALPSQHAQNAASEALTSALLADAHAILARAHADGAGGDMDVDEAVDAELRAAVGRAVLGGVAAGYGMAAQADAQRGPEETEAEADVKRRRTDRGEDGRGDGEGDGDARA